MIFLRNFGHQNVGKTWKNMLAKHPHSCTGMHCPQDQDWHLPPGSCHQTPFLEKPGGWFRQRWGLINKHEDLVWATRMGICDTTVCWFYHIIHQISYIISHISYIIYHISSSYIISSFLAACPTFWCFLRCDSDDLPGLRIPQGFPEGGPSMLWTKRYSLDTAETSHVKSAKIIRMVKLLVLDTA